jgi:hypothetical protein
MASPIDIGHLLAKLAQYMYPLRMLYVERVRHVRKSVNVVVSALDDRGSVGSIGGDARRYTVHSNIAVEQDKVR